MHRTMPRSGNFRKFTILLLTSTNSNSELRKDFLDRKKVLKSLEANSSISPQNYVIPARYHTKQHPNVWVGKAKIHLHHPIINSLRARTKTYEKWQCVSFFWRAIHMLSKSERITLKNKKVRARRSRKGGPRLNFF